MDIKLDCIPCIANSVLKLCREGRIPTEQQESLMRRVLALLAEARYDRAPASLGRDIHRMIRDHLGDPDPYREIKAAGNREMLDLLPRLRQLVAESDRPQETALRLAMAGNIIDFGVDHGISVLDTIDRVLETDLGHDDSAELLREITTSESLLYIGDNCGEIVLDRLFLETLGHPNVTFVVRSSPILNDATMVEARQVGIDRLARLITTGEDAPGAVWESASEEFRRSVAEADVVISKGQGNLEGLMNAPYPIYYVLVAKCDLIAESLGVKKGDFVIKKRSA
ncbi:DUF89 family protein [candidate division KSB1 bacterium]|nr:DUF89 family protein [candidate division KSB1 bacterium]